MSQEPAEHQKTTRAPTTLRGISVQGLPTEVKVGDTLDPEVFEAVMKINATLSDPTRVRPFIDMPVFEGGFPNNLVSQRSVINEMVESYRLNNPMVIMGSGVHASGASSDTDYDFSNNLYAHCLSAFTHMIKKIKEGEHVPYSPRFDRLVFENVAFPRIIPNVSSLKAILQFIEYEQKQAALVIHLCFLHVGAPTSVYSTRYAL